ncbi:hypothetical protein DV736_g2240, partial [Chaetothyriales sp. CBS 134916]
MSMNFFRVLGDVSHTASKCILIWAIHWNRSAEGVSLLTQLLYITVFVTRYLDLFWVPPTRSWWNFVLKNFYIWSSIYIVVLMTRVYARTREREKAWRLGAYALGASMLAAPLVSLIFNGVRGSSIIEILWTFSIILESVCVLPQLLLLRQTTVPTVIDSFYLLTLGLYRAFYLLNWIYRLFTPNKPDPISVIFGIVQTAFYADFAWVYYTRQRVKLRAGGVVDSSDLRKGWLVNRIIDTGRTSQDEDPEERANGDVEDENRRPKSANRGKAQAARSTGMLEDNEAFLADEEDEEDDNDVPQLDGPGNKTFNSSQEWSQGKMPTVTLSPERLPIAAIDALPDDIGQLKMMVLVERARAARFESNVSPRRLLPMPMRVGMFEIKCMCSFPRFLSRRDKPEKVEVTGLNDTSTDQHLESDDLVPEFPMEKEERNDRHFTGLHECKNIKQFIQRAKAAREHGDGFCTQYKVHLAERGNELETQSRCHELDWNLLAWQHNIESDRGTSNVGRATIGRFHDRWTATGTHHQLSGAIIARWDADGQMGKRPSLFIELDIPMRKLIGRIVNFRLPLTTTFPLVPGPVVLSELIRHREAFRLVGASGPRQFGRLCVAGEDNRITLIPTVGDINPALPVLSHAHDGVAFGDFDFGQKTLINQLADRRHPRDIDILREMSVPVIQHPLQGRHRWMSPDVSVSIQRARKPGATGIEITVKVRRGNIDAFSFPEDKCFDIEPGHGPVMRIGDKISTSEIAKGAICQNQCNGHMIFVGPSFRCPGRRPASPGLQLLRRDNLNVLYATAGFNTCLELGDVHERINLAQSPSVGDYTLGGAALEQPHSSKGSSQYFAALCTEYSAGAIGDL